MKFRRLGSTDLILSEVGFGLWTLSAEAWRGVAENDPADLLIAALESGVSYFETADSDGEGYGETLLGNALGRERRHIVIATKVGYDFTDRLAVHALGGQPANFDPQYVRRATEDSLRRLGSDYLDLQLLHHPALDVLEHDSLFETLDDLVDEGKVRYYGIALGPGLDFEAVGEAAIAERAISALQLPYNILDQDPARALSRKAVELDSGVGFIVRSPHASGLLDGTYTKRSRIKRDDGLDTEAYDALTQGIQHLGELDFLTDNMDSTIGQIAIKFALGQPRCASVLPNIAGVSRLREFAAAPETKDLPLQMIDRLTELHDEYFHTADSAGE